jgi:hypothetical protein
MARMMADCRRWPSETNCSLVIIGKEDEVVRTAAEHAASVHRHENTEEVRAQLRDFLEPADQYRSERHPEGALPGRRARNLWCISADEFAMRPGGRRSRAALQAWGRALR